MKAPGSKRFWLFAILGAATLVPAVVGTVLVLDLVMNRPLGKATVDGLTLRLDRALWVDDQMEHHKNYPMPAGMMPDLPPQGVFRLNVDASLFNTNADMRDFQVRELFLRSSTRGMWPCTGGEVTDTLRLKARQAMNIAAHFDVAASEIDPEARLRLLWVREGKTLQMLDIPHPPDHFHDRDSPATAGAKPASWPSKITALPQGDLQRGKVLFARKHGCVSCHGHPDLPESNAVGPHLAGVARRAVNQVPGQTAAQYLYQSILDPNAVIVESKGQLPGQPSSMPPFAELLTPQEMGDLVAYLLSLRD